MKETQIRLCFIIPGFTVPQWWQPLQDQQDDEDTDVCADPQLDQAGSSVQAGQVLQRSGESRFRHHTVATQTAFFFLPSNWVHAEFPCPWQHIGPPLQVKLIFGHHKVLCQVIFGLPGFLLLESMLAICLHFNHMIQPWQSFGLKSHFSWS